MKKLRNILKRIGIVLLILLVLALFFPTWTPKIKGEDSISVLEQVKVNGTRHAIMIRGNDTSNPVLLFVHGGPGVPETSFVTKYQDLLEKQFTVVQYDQRGSGKSYHFMEDYSNLSSDLLVEDLLAMTDYIRNRLHTDKVILAGHSFGTYIAMQAAAKAPEKYVAYLGIGQMSNTAQSERDSLDFCLSAAKEASNQEDIDRLLKIQDTIEKGAGFTPRDLVRKYGGAARLINDNKDITDGFLYQREYNLLDVIRYLRGVLKSQDQLLYPALKEPLPGKVQSLEIPCYFIMGQYDYMTSLSATRTYFDTIHAPKKELLVYDKSAHYPQFEEKEKFYEWMCKTFVKNEEK